MDSMIWAVIEMALFRGESVWSLINKLDIVLPQYIDYVACSSQIPLKGVYSLRQ